MSSLASLYIVDVGDLPAIVSATDLEEAVEEYGEEIGEGYTWSGDVLLNVLENLEESGIRLESAGLRESSEAIGADLGETTLIGSDAKALLGRLDPAAHRPGDLLDGPIDLGLDDEEAGHAMADTLSLLRDTIASLGDDQVLLVSID
ncbi:hypothetical protein [Actinoplanes subglobosus]|uniref:DUF1877 family protein n=1 Tax=Actinoplanes subglobosus TaxID=1547892 RepID=A0ABV8IQJ4_9ACTN